MSWQVQYSTIYYKYVNFFTLKKGFLRYSKVIAVCAFNQSMDYEPKTDTGVKKNWFLLVLLPESLFGRNAALHNEHCARPLPHPFVLDRCYLNTSVGRSCIHPFNLKGHSHEIDFLKVYIYIFKSAFSVCALMFAVTVAGNFFKRLCWENLRTGHTFRGRLPKVVLGLAF
jgi:hypothetical protein